MGDFVLPCPLSNYLGEVRKVGIELEFGGVGLYDAAETIRQALGGELRQDHEHRYTVVTTLGGFEVTFDSSLLSEKKYLQLLDNLGVPIADMARGAVEGVLRWAGGAILPLEVVSPPIPANQLHVLNDLERSLRGLHAEGTRAGVLSAFALHFNPESANPADSGDVVGTLRAFLLLYHWLFRKAEVDLTRRVLPFINPFPEEFTRLVIDPGYAPDMRQFTDDYLRWNPTRNRPLDLLPLLAFNDPGMRSRPEIAGQKVKPRPTYHYRLPNCQIDEPKWSIATEWGRWVLVERLAGRPDLMQQLSRDYLSWDGSILGYLRDRWEHHVEDDWLPLLREPSQTVEQLVG